MATRIVLGLVVLALLLATPPAIAGATPAERAASGRPGDASREAPISITDPGRDDRPAVETAKKGKPDCGKKKSAKQRKKCRERQRDDKPRPQPAPLLCFGKPPTILAIGPAPVSGTDRDDVIVGDAGPNSIGGGSGGVDRICAGGGDDEIGGNEDTDLVFVDGGPGADVVVGGEGNDQLFGGDGDDRLNGSLGNDLLDGGNGNDTLGDGAFGDIDTLVGGPGFDTCDDNTGDPNGPVAC